MSIQFKPDKIAEKKKSLRKSPKKSPRAKVVPLLKAVVKKDSKISKPSSMNLLVTKLFQ